MEQTLRLAQNLNEGRLEVRLVGQIDEVADYSRVDFNSVKIASFDLEGVTLINSTGLQRWITFLESIPSQIKISFERCPARMINQINLFPGFLGGQDIDISSFYAPYFCDSCDAAHSVLLKTREAFPERKNPRAPVVNCPKCAARMDFDGLESKYFLFLTFDAPGK